MRNRFIDLLIKKNVQAEKKAMFESARLYPNPDPTKYDPWNDDLLRDEKDDRD